MSMLFNIIYATRANGTHHKLAMDALTHLESDSARQWQRLFLKHVDVYLEGAKAPDKDFKDFRNHVLHVGDNFWGGAPAKASAWYDKLVRALRDKQFEEAVYCAGVLSHYYSDPLQPFHTGQCEAENNMHRAVEWSISKSYKMLRKRGLKDYAELAVEAGEGDDWIGDMVRRGAQRSHQYYDALISNYNLERGVVDPLSGLNENCHRFLSELLIYASLGFSRILDRAFREAAVQPPQVGLTLDSFLATLAIPLRWVLRKLEDAEEIRAVQNAWDELQQTGKVEKYLNEDDRVVRDLHRREVIEHRVIKNDELEKAREKRRAIRKRRQPTRPSVKAAPVREEKAPRFYLELSDNIEKAPSIGAKTAKRLEREAVLTVADLLAADPADLSTRLNTRWISEQVIRDWQYQARLVCEVAGLRGGHAQILVAAGIKTASALSGMEFGEVHAMMSLYCETREGKNLRACESLPTRDRVENWIRATIEHPRQVAA